MQKVWLIGWPLRHHCIETRPHRTCHAGHANVHPKADALGDLTLILIANVLAGVYGAATVSTRILMVQALPAAVALVALFLA